MLQLLSLASALTLATPVTAGNITAGNIVVERIGDGSTTLNNAAAPIDILEYNTGGTLVQTISIPTSGANRQTESGSASSNGQLNSYNGFITVPGYDADLGTVSVASSNTKTINAIGSDGTIVANVKAPTSGATGTPWRGNNFRSAITGDGINFFGSGTGSGSDGGIWHYSTATTVWTRVSNTQNNTRNVEIYNNNLYFSTGSGTQGIYSLGAVDSLDLSAANLNTATLVIGVNNAYGFYVNDTLRVAYVASDGAAGGIQRFDYNLGTSTWDLSYAFRFDTINLQLTDGSGAGIRGLSVDYDADTQLFTLYATTDTSSDNQLVAFTDGLASTATAGTGYTVLASAGANYVFRGVDIATVPEPGTSVLFLLGGAFILWRMRRGRIRA